MINMDEYGYFYPDDAFPAGEGQVPGRVIMIQRDHYRIICPEGETSATLKGSFAHQLQDKSEYPAVGDFVLLQSPAPGQARITAVLPRKSKFSRTDFSGHAAPYVKTIREQVIAANFDYVLILSSLNQDFNLNRIARYLTQTRHSGAVPVIVLTKADLRHDWQELLDQVRQVAGDTVVIALSSRTGMGLEQLASYVRAKTTSVMLGMSGVGKSSLLNALAGEERMVVKAIREADGRGRHTTTHRELVRLPGGAMMIDTPGLRELGLWEADEGIQQAFADVEAIIHHCRFSDCRHQTEPGCAVQAALADGSLSARQWERYLDQKKEASFVGQKRKPPHRKKSR